MILYLKQTTDPGNILFYVVDQCGHTCYEVGVRKHCFGRRISIFDQAHQEVAYIHCIGFSTLLRCGIFVKGEKRLSLLCKFSASEPLFNINGQTWVFRGEVLLYNFDVVDVDRTVVFTHGKYWTPPIGNVYGITVAKQEFVLESLCISAVIDTFVTETEAVVAAEIN